MSASLRRGIVFAFLIGTACFFLNNLSILAGWIAPPPGYQPLFLIRSDDAAQYFTFTELGRTHWLLPLTHAPWDIGAVYFTPVMLMSGRFSTLFPWPVIVSYHLLHWLFYVFCSGALLYLLATFLPTRRQIGWAVVAAFSALPFGVLAAGIAKAIGRPAFLFMPSLIDYTYMSADGLFRGGTSNSVTITFGTMMVLLALAFLGRFLKSGEARYWKLFLATVFVSSMCHPFEVFVIAPAASLCLLFCSRAWREAIPRILVLGAVVVAGLTPYFIQSWRLQLLRDLRQVFEWHPTVFWFLLTYGLPLILTLYFLLLRYPLKEPSDRVLLIWFLVSLPIVFLPVIPGPVHMLDGVVYVMGALLVRLVFQSPHLAGLYAKRRKLALGMLSAALAITLLGHFTVWRQLFLDGASAQPDVLLTAVAPVDEIATINWLRSRASEDDLVLAPPEQAPWYSTVPTHSFASHEALGVNFARQVDLSRAFYSGGMQPAAAFEFLSHWGVRWIVVPDGSRALAYFAGQAPAGTVGSLRIYEQPSNRMKPYPGLRALQKEVAQAGR